MDFYLNSFFQFRSRFFVTLLTLFFVFLASTSKTFAAATHSVDSASEWNVRIDGERAGDQLGSYRLQSSDFNNDGVDDIIVTAKSGVGENGKTTINITYLIDSSIVASLNGTGNTLDLANSNNYTLKIIAANTGDYSDYYVTDTADLNGNNKTDVLISHGLADHGGVSNRGAVYVLYDSIIDDYSGTGNLLDLSDSTKFNVKFIGAATGDNLGYSSNIKDLDGDGAPDLTMVAQTTDYNSRSNSGSAYIVYNNLLSTFTGTGNVIDLGTSSNYNIRVDGPVSGGGGVFTQSYIVSSSSDVNSDGVSDLLVLAAQTDFNHPDSGSAYVLYSTFLSSITGTGNTLDLADPADFNLRYDGAGNGSGGLGYAITQAADINGNDRNDLMLVDSYTDLDGNNSSGSGFLIFDTLIDDYSGTGNIISLENSSNYNIRIDGGQSSTYVAENMHAIDYDNDGKLDIKLDSTNRRKIWYINQNLINQYSGTGNLINMTDEDQFSLLYTSSGAIHSTYSIGDINADHSTDFLFTAPLAGNNSRGSSGSIYLVYNFPHTITGEGSVVDATTITLQGTVTAQNSATTIAGVQVQQDSNNPTGSWSACQAVDGTFDSTTEAYTCTLSVVDYNNYVAYVRAYDENTVYTPQSGYKLISTQIPHTSNGGSSGGSFSPSYPQQCASNVPVGTPDLFQINRTAKTAQLFFTPVSDNTRNYHVLFGYKEGDERFGALSQEVSASSNTGVIQLTINELDPNQEYWFKVVPVNGCAVGSWSNWLKVGTFNQKSSIFYRYLPAALSN